MEELREQIAEKIKRMPIILHSTEGNSIISYIDRYKLADQILKLIKEADYVKLAEDQAFPSGIRAVEKTLKERSWRRVILEVKE